MQQGIQLIAFDAFVSMLVMLASSNLTVLPDAAAAPGFNLEFAGKF